MRTAAVLALLLSLAALAANATEDLLDAARKGDLARVKAALESQAGLESKTRQGQTPLYLAAMNGHVEVVKFLVDQGARVDVTDNFYRSTAIGIAASRKYTPIVKLLLARSTDCDRNLDTATSLRDTALVTAVLASGKPSQAALDRNFALAASHAEIHKLLQKAGAQPPAPGVAVDIRVLASYTGSYHAEDFPLDVNVFVRDGKLYAQASGKPEFAPRAKSATRFDFAPANAELEFTGPGALTLSQNGHVYRFRKAITQ